MRLSGILLIFANLIAGGAFVYFATQDWKGRQSISAAVLRHALVLQGLPLEPAPGGETLIPDKEGEPQETPFVVELGGGESTKTISKKLLESYFEAASAGASAAPAPVADPAAPATATTPSLLPDKATQAVTNQISEVKRVQGVIKAALATDANAETKINLLKGWLLYQAENFDTRTAYLDLISPTDANGQPKSADQRKADAAKLEEALDARFKGVLDKPQLSDGPASTMEEGAAATDKEKIEKAREKLEKSASWRSTSVLDETERRMRLAHLLAHLDQSAAWQKRVAVIVGLRRYVKAITVQVLRFKDMIDHVELGIPGDQAAFVKQENLAREKAIQNAERAKIIAEEKAKLAEQKIATDDSVSRRRTQLKELTDQLNRIKAEVDEALVGQSRIEKQLYEIQREVGLTLEEVYRLEELLDATERERLGLPPRVSPRP